MKKRKNVVKGSNLSGVSISHNEMRRKRKAEKVKAVDSGEKYEDGMNYAEVCRIHMIGNPADLDSALGDYELMANEMQHFTVIEKPLVRNGELLCPKCNKPINDAYKHCPDCGRRIGWKY